MINYLKKKYVFKSILIKKLLDKNYFKKCPFLELKTNI